MSKKDSQEEGFIAVLADVSAAVTEVSALLKDISSKDLSKVQQQDVEQAKKLLGKFKNAFESLSNSVEFSSIRPISDFVHLVDRSGIYDVVTQITNTISVISNHPITAAVVQVIQKAHKVIGLGGEVYTGKADKVRELGKNILDLGKSILDLGKSVQKEIYGASASKNTPHTEKNNTPQFLKTLDEVEKNIAKSAKLLVTTSNARLNGKQAQDLAHAKKILSDFQDAFIELQKTAKETALSNKNEEVSESKVFKSKFETVIKWPLYKLQNIAAANPIVKAVVTCIKKACNVVATIGNSEAVEKFTKATIALNKAVNKAKELGAISRVR